MFNRLLALTVTYYFDSANRRHLDLSAIEKVVKDDVVTVLTVNRFYLPDITLTYTSQEDRDRAYNHITELLNVTYQGSSSW